MTQNRVGCVIVKGFVLENGFAKVLLWFDGSSKLIRWNAWDKFQIAKLNFQGQGRLHANGVFVWLYSCWSS